MRNDMSSAIHDQQMEFQHLPGNILGWQQLKRQPSPSRETRPLKKRYGSENISPGILNGNSQAVKKLNVKKKPLTTNAQETIMETHQEREVVPSVIENVSDDDFDMDDILPIELNLSKVPMKYCDDRVFTQCSPKDVLKAENPIDDTYRQADENFKEKIRKPLNELMEIFGINTNEECLQLYFVGMKLQLLGMRSTKMELDKKAN